MADPYASQLPIRTVPWNLTAGTPGGIYAGYTWTDSSISSATGASQAILAASTTASARLIVNNSATDWTINPTGGTASVGGDGCIKLSPGDSFSTQSRNAITGIGTTASKLTVLEG